jgi:transcriptional regulator with XRE-family HTH domain
MDTNTVIVKCNLDVIAKRRKLTAYQIAAMTGLSNPVVYSVLKGNSPNLQTLTRLANGLKLRPAQLLRFDPAPKPAKKSRNI